MRRKALVAPARPERAGPPVAVKLALRELDVAREQFDLEDSTAALHAAASGHHAHS